MTREEQREPVDTAGPAAGEHIDARSAASAAAVRAALAGIGVREAYQQQGITLPPPGTPVIDPVAPWQLKAGDIGVGSTTLALALGNGKALTSGRIQAIDTVSAGPDFLGWFDPTSRDSAMPHSDERAW